MVGHYISSPLQSTSCQMQLLGVECVSKLTAVAYNSGTLGNVGNLYLTTTATAKKGQE